MLDPDTTLTTMAQKSWRFDRESHDDDNSYHDDVDGGDEVVDNDDGDDDVDNDDGDDNVDNDDGDDDVDNDVGDDDVDYVNCDDDVDSPLARFGRRVPTSPCLGQTVGVAEKRKIQKIQDERKYNICITNTKTQNNAMYQ